MDPVSIATAAGSALGGVADIISSVGQVRRQKKIIAAQEQSQKNLMDYQNNIQRQNIADDRAYNEDWTDRYFNKYESMAARRADAEAAGFSPEAAIGLGSSGAGSATSGSSVGGVTIPGSPDIPEKSTAAGIVSGIGQMMESLSNIKQLQFDEDMREGQRKASLLDLAAKEQELLRMRYNNELLGNTVDRIGKDNDYVDWSRDRDKEAWRLNSRDQHLGFLSAWDEYKRDGQRWKWELEDRPTIKERQHLQNDLLKGRINNENWLYRYRKITGKNPPSNMTFLEFVTQMFGLGLPEGDTPAERASWFGNQVSSFGKSFGQGLKQGFFESNDSVTNTARQTTKDGKIGYYRKK